MFNIFQFDTPFLISSLILLTMSCLSLIFSISFHLKSRAIKKLPENLSVNVFNKTFNVFDPYPSSKKMINSFGFIVLLSLVVVFGTLIFAFILMVKVFEMGLILGLTILIICSGLMIIDEAFETYKNANIFVRAIGNGVNLGKGDLTVLLLVKKTLPKLKAYYLSLTTIFFAFSIALPYIVPQVLFAFAQFVGVMFESVSSTGFIEVYTAFLTTLLFAIVTIIIEVAAKKVKSKLIGFPSSESISHLVRQQFESMKSFATGRSLNAPEHEKMAEGK